MDKDPRHDVKYLVGICGFYCGTCPDHLASRENDQQQLRKISEEASIALEEIRCTGCLSERVLPHCKECRYGFRRCAKEKNVPWCFQWDEFPCHRLSKFRDVHIVNDIFHHAHIIEDLRHMKEHGVERRAEDQEEKGRYPQCGKALYWSPASAPVVTLRFDDPEPERGKRIPPVTSHKPFLSSPAPRS